MSVRGWKYAAGLAVLPLALVACGNDKPGTGGSGGPAASVSTPAPQRDAVCDTFRGTITDAVHDPVGDAHRDTHRRTHADQDSGETSGDTDARQADPPDQHMLLTGGEVAKGDPKRGWAATGGTCQYADLRPRVDPRRRSARRTQPQLHQRSRRVGRSVADPVRRGDGRAAAYDSILKTIASCKAAGPAPTHARKITEDRAVAVGDATRIVRWYDYPLPSDQGSEDGGFPYAVTRKGAIVSVVAFREMGKGIKPANFEAIARCGRHPPRPGGRGSDSVRPLCLAMAVRERGGRAADQARQVARRTGQRAAEIASSTSASTCGEALGEADLDQARHDVVVATGVCTTGLPVCRAISAANSSNVHATSPPSSYAWLRCPSVRSTTAAAAA